MRRVLPDEGVPIGVREQLTGFSVVSAAEAAGFAIMVTADQNIRYQQNLKSRSLALVVLTTYHWATIRTYGAEILASVESADQGSYLTLELPKPALRRRPPPRPGG